MFNVFSYDVVLSQDSNLSPPQRRANALRIKPWLQVNFIRVHENLVQHPCNNIWITKLCICLYLVFLMLIALGMPQWVNLLFLPSVADF